MEVVKILLLGESGTGKSTFINSFANYFCNASFAEAISREPVCLIPARFTVVDGDFREHPLEIGNLDVAIGSSVTQEPKEYIIDVDNLRVHIIDTPGVGDSRGVEKDMENINLTMAYVAGCDKLHAICFLLPPNVSVLNEYFRFCLKSLLSIVQPAVLQNIIFVFTNTRSTFYRPGDTFMLLKRVLAEDESMCVPCSKRNIFCVDNEAFKYLVASRNGVSLQDDDEEAFACSWAVSTKACKELLSYICNELKPHRIETGLTEKQVLSLVEDIFPVLVDALVTLEMNINIFRCEHAVHDTPFVKMVALDKPQYICNDMGCLNILQDDNVILIANDQKSLALHTKDAEKGSNCSLCDHDIKKHDMSHYKKLITYLDNHDYIGPSALRKERSQLLIGVIYCESVLKSSGLSFQEELKKNVINNMDKSIVDSLNYHYDTIKHEANTSESPSQETILQQIEYICRLKYIGKPVFYIKAAQEKSRFIREQEIHQQQLLFTKKNIANSHGKSNNTNSVDARKTKAARNKKENRQDNSQKRMPEKVVDNNRRQRKVEQTPKNTNNSSKPGNVQEKIRQFEGSARKSLPQKTGSNINIVNRDVTVLHKKLKESFQGSIPLNIKNVRLITQMVIDNVDIKKLIATNESVNVTKEAEHNNGSYSDAVKSPPNTESKSTKGNQKF